MKITEISPQKKNEGRMNVFVDGEYCFSLEKIDVLKLCLKQGLEITSEELDFYKLESGFNKAKSCALDLISRKPVTKKMVFEKLTEKGYDRELADNVVAELLEEGLLNDEEYAYIFAEYAQSKGWGEKKFKYELIQRGVEANIIEDVLFHISFADTESLKNMLLRKYPDGDFKDIKLKQKAMRFLASRGFGFSHINKAINELAEE